MGRRQSSNNTSANTKVHIIYLADTCVIIQIKFFSVHKPNFCVVYFIVKTIVNNRIYNIMGFFSDGVLWYRLNNCAEFCGRNLI